MLVRMDRPGDLRPATTAIRGRLGVDIPRDQWPTAATLKGVEASGFAWVQVRTPPAAMLRDRGSLRRHARALRANLDSCGLRLVLHGPDDLSVGTLDHDRAFDGLLDYAREARAELVVYHGLAFAGADGPGGDRARLRVHDEERSLARLARRAHALGLTVAVENLAPVHPGPSLLSHDPLRVHDLVRRLRMPSLGMLLDIGHAHITCALAGTDLGDVLRRVADDVVLFHVHDNLGCRRHDVGFPDVDPLRLDLHLPPGGGTLPWDRVRAALRGHHAPLLLEIAPPHRPQLVALQRTASALLTGDRLTPTRAVA